MALFKYNGTESVGDGFRLDNANLYVSSLTRGSSFGWRILYVTDWRWDTWPIMTVGVVWGSEDVREEGPPGWNFIIVLDILSTELNCADDVENAWMGDL